MNFRKSKYYPSVLVLIVLMLVGCGEKAEEPEDPGVKPQMTQSEYVKGAIAEMMKKMKCDENAVIANEIGTQRSLAVHILKNHTALMAHFISQHWDMLPNEKVGGQELYTFDKDGNRELSPDAPNIFWQRIYADVDCASDEATIELEANVKEVWLEDVDDLIWNCRARVDYEFRGVCRDKNGIVVNSQRGEVRFWLCHRDPCPWYDECPLFDKIID